MKFLRMLKIILRLIFSNPFLKVTSLQRSQYEDADKSYRKIIQDYGETHIPKDTMPTLPKYFITEEYQDDIGSFIVWEDNRKIFTVHYIKDSDIEREVYNWNESLGIAYKYCENYILNKNQIKINL